MKKCLASETLYCSLYFTAFDDSSWEVAIIVASHGDSPWGNIANINSSAKWVWTSTGDDEIYCRLPLGTLLLNLFGPF